MSKTVVAFDDLNEMDGVTKDHIDKLKSFEEVTRNKAINCGRHVSVRWVPNFDKKRHLVGFKLTEYGNQNDILARISLKDLDSTPDQFGTMLMKKLIGTP